VDEALKAVRSVHIAIVTLALTIIAFTLWPSTTQRYDGAIRDVEALKQLPVDDFERYATNAAAAFPEVNQLKAQIEAIVRTSGCSLPSDWLSIPLRFSR
jgi:hypothetical protein